MLIKVEKEVSRWVTELLIVSKILKFWPRIMKICIYFHELVHKWQLFDKKFRTRKLYAWELLILNYESKEDGS